MQTEQSLRTPLTKYGHAHYEDNRKHTTTPTRDKQGTREMLDLSAVTLLCVDTRSPELALWAMKRCMSHAHFANAVLMTELAKVQTLSNDGIEYVQCPGMSSTREYSEVMLRGIAPYVSGTHVLIVQWDGFILHPDLWDSSFLNYDYIGAVWPQLPKTPVGNGGFSLRSKKLLDALHHPDIIIEHPEDLCICVTNRQKLEEDGLRFAPPEVAERFSVERTSWHPSFGFHGFFNFANALSEDEIKKFIDKVPTSCCQGIDSYHLIDDLLGEENRKTAAAPFRKCRRRRKSSMRFLTTCFRENMRFSGRH